MLKHEIAPYEPDLHRGFVRISWCKGARQPWENLERVLDSGRVNCVVAHTGNPDSLLGWAAVHVPTGAVVWVYVRSLHGKARRQGLGTALLRALEVDTGTATPCLNWSPVASLIAGPRHRIFFTPNPLPKET